MKLDEIRSRIMELYASKIGAEAALLEFKVFEVRIRFYRWLRFAAFVWVLAVILRSWPIGFVAVAIFAVSQYYFYRTFYLRHLYFVAVSRELGVRVSWRHPVRGLPTWRRTLSNEKLAQLERSYRHWCDDRNLPYERPTNPSQGS